MELGTNQKTWINALRSGEYLQCQNELCTHDGNGANYYCCLGVANTIFHLNAQDNETLDGTNFNLVLGLRTHDGEIHYNEDDEEEFGYLTLVEMNDDGKTFVEIADFIEANPTLVFTKSV